MQAIGAREGERLSAMFDTAIADGAKVDVFDSGKAAGQGQREELRHRAAARPSRTWRSSRPNRARKC